MIPGHEPAGDVVEVGPGVRGVQPGDRVAAYLAIGCGECPYCKSGYLYLCARFRCLGFDVNGGDADYLVIPAENCLKLPDQLSYESAAVMTDNIGTQYHYIPLYRHPLLVKNYGKQQDAFPEMEIYYKQSLTLPLFVDLEEADVERVVKALKKAVAL